jgi:hypothetical protein
MAETFLLAEEKHAQEPFLLHRTRSFRVVRSFHDNWRGSAAPTGELCRIARYVRSGKHAGHVRTERRPADLVRRRRRPATGANQQRRSSPGVGRHSWRLTRGTLLERRCCLPGAPLSAYPVNATGSCLASAIRARARRREVLPMPLPACARTAACPPGDWYQSLLPGGKLAVAFINTNTGTAKTVTLHTPLLGILRTWSIRTAVRDRGRH